MFRSSYKCKLNGAVVQLVRTPACHAGGRGFKSLPRRHLTIPGNVPVRYNSPQYGGSYADIAQSVERILGKDEVGSSNLPISSIEKPRSHKGYEVFYV